MTHVPSVNTINFNLNGRTQLNHLKTLEDPIEKFNKSNIENKLENQNSNLAKKNLLMKQLFVL